MGKRVGKARRKGGAHRVSYTHGVQLYQARSLEVVGSKKKTNRQDLIEIKRIKNTIGNTADISEWHEDVGLNYNIVKKPAPSVFTRPIKLSSHSTRLKDLNIKINAHAARIDHNDIYTNPANIAALRYTTI